MDSSKINDWAQVVGIFALVASLIFVGLQMKQTHNIAIAGQYQARADATQDLFMTMQESGLNVMEVMSKARVDPTPQEHTASLNISQWGWTQYENHHFQYTAGFLDEESWNGLSVRIERLYNTCQVRPVYEDHKVFFRASFRAYVESLQDRCLNQEPE